MELNNCSSDVLGEKWCIVDYSLLALSFILFIITVKIIQFFQYCIFLKSISRLSSSQHWVFIGQLAQTLAMTVHYTFLGNSFNVIFLIQEYFVSVQYSLVFYYFISQLYDAFRILQGLAKVKLPLIIINVLMLVGCLVYVGVITGINGSVYNCNNGIWIYLHSCNMVLSLIFICVGLKAKQLLQILKENSKVIINVEKIRQFWYFVNRLIILSMFVASIVNVGESAYYLDIDNFSCYNSYSQNPYVDIIIFCVIRLFSHYLFILSCLYIFRMERITKSSIIDLSDSDTNIIVASYYEDDPFEDKRYNNSIKINQSGRSHI